MNTPAWVERFKQELWANLEGVQHGDYASAVAVNLVIVLDGYNNGQIPEQVARAVCAVELAALGRKRG